MPSFSNSLTNAASVNLLIGLVKCCLGSRFLQFNFSPFVTSGRIISLSSLSFLLSTPST